MPGKKLAALVAGLVILGGLLLPSLAAAQGRTNDKDMEVLIRNLRDDSKSFQPAFNEAVKRSVIRKTSQEKDARNLVSRFVRQTDASLNVFRRTRKTGDTLPMAFETATQINKLVYDLNLDHPATDRWEKVRAALHQVSSAAGLPDPMGNATASPPSQ